MQTGMPCSRQIAWNSVSAPTEFPWCARVTFPKSASVARGGLLPVGHAMAGSGEADDRLWFPAITMKSAQTGSRSKTVHIASLSSGIKNAVIALLSVDLLLASEGQW
jgi:hypothetical protein